MTAESHNAIDLGNFRHFRLARARERVERAGLVLDAMDDAMVALGNDAPDFVRAAHNEAVVEYNDALDERDADEAA
jgi:hypothetical protein